MSDCHICDWTARNGGRCAHHAPPARMRHFTLGGKLFAERGGQRWRVLSLCLDDPRQPDVIALPMVAVGQQESGAEPCKS